MNEHRSKNSPHSSVERLANVYNSLADDVFDVPLDTDEETNQRAVRLADAALEKVLASEALPDSVSNSPSPSPSTNVSPGPEPSADKPPVKAPKRGLFAILIDILFGGAPKQESQPTKPTAKNDRPLIEDAKKDPRIVQHINVLTLRQTGRWSPDVPIDPNTQPKNPSKPGPPPKPPDS